LNNFQNFKKLGAINFDFVVAVSPRIPSVSTCSVFGQFLYAHHFKYLQRRKSGTARSGDLTGHWIPDTWKWSSLLTNTLRTPPIRCQWTGFEV